MTIDYSDWESLLSFDDDSFLPPSIDDFFFGAPPTDEPQFDYSFAADANPNIDAPDEDQPSWIEEIENLLMQDDDADQVVNHEEIENLLRLDDDADQTVNHEEFENLLADQTVNHEEIVVTPAASPSSDSKDAGSDSVPQINIDGLSKKELRQLRNRDAAVKSRERKKSYVKDLEMKSRYMEAECRRLDRLLQCCYAENNMLRVSLHNAAAFSGCFAKAESAVLSLESLLLVSLLWWLLATVCLPPPPKEAVSLENASRNLEAPPPRSRGSKLTGHWKPPSFLSKTCRSARTRMKATCSRAVL